MSYRDIPTGWSWDIEPFYKWAAERLPQNGVFVEVGVFLGRSLAYMGELRPDLDLWAIDPWSEETSQGYQGPAEHTDLVKPHGTLWRAFNHYLSTCSPGVYDRVHVMRTKSLPVVLPVMADMIFLDGSHDYATLFEEIACYQFYMRAGGILSGHDYDADNPNQENQDVVRAVNDALGGQHKMGPTPESTCWWATA